MSDSSSFQSFEQFGCLCQLSKLTTLALLKGLHGFRWKIYFNVWSPSLLDRKSELLATTKTAEDSLECNTRNRNERTLVYALAWEKQVLPFNDVNFFFFLMAVILLLFCLGKLHHSDWIVKTVIKPKAMSIRVLWNLWNLWNYIPSIVVRNF